MLAKIKNNLYLSKFLTNRLIRKLPPSVLWQFWQLMRHEKITKYGESLLINYFLPPFPSQAFNRYIKNILLINKEGKFLPKDLIISLTNRCPYNCWYCYNKYTEGKDLPWSEVKKVVDYFENLGVFKIGLSGGEPLLRDDLEKIIKYINKLGILVTLSTSGYGLDEKRANSLKKAGLTSVQISIDNYCQKKKENKKIETRETFQIALNGLKTALKAGLYANASLTINSQMMKDNFLEKYVDFIESLGVPEIRILEIKPTGNLIRHPDNNIFLTQAQRKELISWQKKINDNSKRKIKIFIHNYYEDKKFLGCQAGANYLYIDARGNIRPCVFSSLSFGNITTEDINKIYARFKKYLPYPRTSCLAFDTYKSVVRHFDNQLPLDRKISVDIIKKIKKTDLPEFYKKIVK